MINQKSSGTCNYFPTGFRRSIQLYAPQSNFFFYIVHIPVLFPSFFYWTSVEPCYTLFHTLPMMFIGERIEMFFRVLNHVPNSLVYWCTPIPDFL